MNGCPSQRVLQLRLFLGILCSCVLMTIALVDGYWLHLLTASAVRESIHPILIVDSATTNLVRRMERRIKQQLPQLTCEQRPSNDAPFAFTSTGHLCVSDLPEVQLTIQRNPADDGASGQLLNISLPLPMSQLLQLRDAAQPSQLGVGQLDQLNLQLRSSLDIPADRIQMSESIHHALHRIKDDIVEKFIRHAVTADTQRDLASWMLRLSLHKLIMYTVGDSFVRHRDAYKSEGQLATIIVLLPTATTAAAASEHEALVGGVVKVRRSSSAGLGWLWHAADNSDETEVVWDAAMLPKEIAATGTASVVNTCGKDAVPLHYLVFWSDCEHEVTRVESGHRVVLMFNVIFERDVMSVAYRRE